MGPDDKGQAPEKVEFEEHQLSQQMPRSIVPTSSEDECEGRRHARKDKDINQVEEVHEFSPAADPTSNGSVTRQYITPSLASTQSASLDNPFALFDTVERLIESVRCFATNHKLLGKLPILSRAAQIERDEYRTLQDVHFPEEERTALEAGRDASFWKQSSDLRAACLVVGILSAACQGWAQSVLNGSALAVAKEFGLHVNKNDAQRNNADLYTYGLLTAIVSLSSGVLSLFIADPIQNHWLGRRGAIAVSTGVGIAATIGAACSQSIPQLLGCRILTGASLGAKASIISPFLAELAPVHMRGSLLSLWQIGDALGIFAGFICYFVVEHNAQSPEQLWRILTLTALLPAVPLLFASYMVPESYIFLMKTGKYPQAAQAACSYRKSEIEGYRNFISSHFQMEAEEELMRLRKARTTPAHHNRETLAEETKPLAERLTAGPPGRCVELENPPTRDDECPHHYQMKKRNFYLRLWHVFEDVRCRRALLSSAIPMMAQSLGGINCFAFFSSSLLNAGIPNSVSLALGLSFGGVNFVLSSVTPLLTDRLGRTTLMLIGLPIMTVFMFILAAVFEVENASRTPTIILFTLLFCAIYSFTLGPAAYSLAAENFPSSVREAGMAICVFINTTSLGVLLLVYPFVTAPIGYTASLCICGCINILAFFACLLFCVDTKDRTLDELQYSFDLPLMIHCEYRLLYVVPEAWKHYSELLLRLLGRQPATEDEETGSFEFQQPSEWGLVPFHRWARIEYVSASSSRTRRSFGPQ